MLKEALEAGADIIMLDNMTPQEMEEAIALIDGRAKTEASGNITLDNIAEVAKTGVDIISLGALTHSVKAFDISMKTSMVFSRYTPPCVFCKDVTCMGATVEMP